MSWNNVQQISVHQVQFEMIASRGILSNNTNDGNTETGQITHSQFAVDPAQKGVASAIEIQAGFPARIIGNHFFEGFLYHIFTNWTTPARSGEAVVNGNIFDFPVSYAVIFQRAGGSTGTLGTVSIVGNVMSSSVTYPGGFLSIPTNAAQWTANFNVVGNNLYLGDSGATGINFAGGGGAAGDGSYIGGNTIYGTSGTGIRVGDGFTQIVVGENWVFGSASAYNISSNRGVYFPGNASFGGLPVGFILTQPVTIPNNKYFATRASGGAGSRLIGQDGSDVVQIAPDGQAIKTGGKVTVAGTATIGSATFASLGTPALGTIVYCSDCKNSIDDSVTLGAACLGGGHGAFAFRQSSLTAMWSCK